MSWFGGGGSSSNDNSSSSSSSSYSSDFSSDSSQFAAPQSSGGNLQEQLQIEQQKAMIQTVMLKLTDLSFERCVNKPSSSLSSSEVNCINSVVGKYLDSSEFIVGRLQKQGGQM